MRKFTKRSAAIATAAAVVIGGAGAAYAWTIGSGTGSANAKAATTQNLVIAPAATVDDELYPGHSSSLTLSVSNKNKYVVKVDKVTIGAITDLPAGCSAGDFTIDSGTGTPTVFTFTAKDVAAGDGTNAGAATSITVPNAVTMKDTAAQECVNAAFKVAVDGVHAFVGTAN
jgi:hypothetical protein